MKYKLTIGSRILSAIIVAAAIVHLGGSALAVETGTGTNQMANVYATNSINLRGSIITSWGDVGGGDLTSLSNNVTALQGATNALNTRVGTSETDVTGLKGATNALNTRVGTAETDVTGLKGATNALNTRVGTAETDVTGLKGATNALNTRIGTAETDIGTLQTDVSTVETDVTALKASTNTLNSGKYDKTGGTISGDMTLTGKAIYTPGAQQIADNATTVSVAQAVAKIGNDGTAVTFASCVKQIAAGTSGQFLTVMCTNNAPIRLNNGQGVKLVEGVSFSLNANDVIQLVYDGANWVEVHRADN